MTIAVLAIVEEEDSAGRDPCVVEEPAYVASWVDEVLADVDAV